MRKVLILALTLCLLGGAPVLAQDDIPDRPPAWQLDKPAVFEYLIRDFIDKPWRYQKSVGEIAKKSGVVWTLCIACLVLGKRRSHD